MEFYQQFLSLKVCDRYWRQKMDLKLPAIATDPAGTATLPPNSFLNLDPALETKLIRIETMAEQLLADLGRMQDLLDDIDDKLANLDMRPE